MQQLQQNNRMDLDQNAAIPLLKGHYPNAHANKANPNARGRRTFGQDLTNQHRSHSNSNILPPFLNKDIPLKASSQTTSLSNSNSISDSLNSKKPKLLKSHSLSELTDSKSFSYRDRDCNQQTLPQTRHQSLDTNENNFASSQPLQSLHESRAFDDDHHQQKGEVSQKNIKVLVDIADSKTIEEEEVAINNNNDDDDERRAANNDEDEDGDSEMQQSDHEQEEEAPNDHLADIDDDIDPELDDYAIESADLAPWDVKDAHDDLAVSDYIAEIMLSIRRDEDENRGGCIIENNEDFMSRQTDINARMRTVLVDWLVEVHRKFKLLPSTYFLAINLLDRYLSKKQLNRRRLQLCGCTCLWIASKYHEIYAPEMDDFVYISDNAFSDDDLMEMEVDILKTLSFVLTVPTVLNYAKRYGKVSAFYLKKEREQKIIADLIMYCTEHAVMAYELCRYKPSMIGAACFVYSCVSTKVFGVEQFETDELENVIGYSMEELKEIMAKIDGIVRSAKRSKYRAIYKKYCNPKYSNIGKLNFDKLNTKFLVM